ncbi:MAG: nucleotide pyrophosphohydrolase [Gemmatimonadetes bacterium]|jgi:NTP pyrophosphatase (non-canonical NTP hydrolase)|nr:nucleotide pyrophosphohydrolase [Gemmatimonadota bacterium]MBT4611229.1 nucleotide pyrophosphohydrolase [Gemmatimonadota bacterium]MBT5059101.1 nucleotide pyrophosphohydrolase [Gemmatimonadota bacterium]MBT5145701.1 nucleotide pyrophosphohydrolase [Gemmatimonadota bacterium]MBT5588069.1 nucleotide pyrophosphohydrolase [Gemmatimonadota bacterium]
MADAASLKDLQSQVDEWIRDVGVRYYSELTNTAILAEEVGEVSRLMARLYGDQSFKAGHEKGLADVAEELSDVLFVVICLANQTGIDLQEAFDLAMDKRTQRDRERHASNPKLKA